MFNVFNFMHPWSTQSNTARRNCPLSTGAQISKVKKFQRYLWNYLGPDLQGCQSLRSQPLMDRAAWQQRVDRLSEELQSIYAMVDLQSETFKKRGGVYVAHPVFATLYIILKVILLPQEAMRVSPDWALAALDVLNPSDQPYPASAERWRMRMKIATDKYLWLTYCANFDEASNDAQILGALEKLITGDEVPEDVSSEQHARLVSNPGQHNMLFGLYRKTGNAVLDKVFRDFMPLSYAIVDAGQQYSLDVQVTPETKMIAQLRLVDLILQLQSTPADCERASLLDRYNAHELQNVNQQVSCFLNTVSSRVHSSWKDVVDNMMQTASAYCAVNAKNLQDTITLRRELQKEKSEGHAKVEERVLRSTTVLRRQLDQSQTHLRRLTQILEWDSFAGVTDFSNITDPHAWTNVVPKSHWVSWLGTALLICWMGPLGLYFAMAPLLWQQVLRTRWFREKWLKSYQDRLPWLVRSFKVGFMAWLVSCVVCHAPELLLALLSVDSQLSIQFFMPSLDTLWPILLWVFNQLIIVSAWGLAVHIRPGDDTALVMWTSVLWWPLMVLQWCMGSQALTRLLLRVFATSNLYLFCALCVLVPFLVLACILVNILTTMWNFVSLVLRFLDGLGMQFVRTWIVEMLKMENSGVLLCAPFIYIYRLWRRTNITSLLGLSAEKSHFCLLVLTEISWFVLTGSVIAYVYTIVPVFALAKAVFYLPLYHFSLWLQLSRALPVFLRLHCFLSVGEYWNLLVGGVLQPLSDWVQCAILLRSVQDASESGGVRIFANFGYLLGWAAVACAFAVLPMDVNLLLNMVFLQCAVTCVSKGSGPLRFFGLSSKIFMMYDHLASALLCLSFFPGVQSCSLLLTTLWQEIKSLVYDAPRSISPERKLDRELQLISMRSEGPRALDSSSLSGLNAPSWAVVCMNTLPQTSVGLCYSYASIINDIGGFTSGERMQLCVEI